MNINDISSLLWYCVTGWPLLIYVVSISMIYTIVFRGIQFRYFFTALKATVSPSQNNNAQVSAVTPFQAFINTINSNLGNGSIAGMGNAIFIGGPGAAFWVVAFGFILMAIRFAEVYISTLYGAKATDKSALGGPMLYLKDVPGGKFVPYIYAVSCFTFGLLGGNAIQSNSISVSLAATWGIAPLMTAIVLLAFVLYILFGGAQRIIQISVSIVPIKVIVFLLSTIAVLVFHYQSLVSALYLIIKSAFGLHAFGAGVVGFSLQQVIAAGMSRSIFATESGLGSAAILFGSTGNDDAVQNGFMGMTSTFISTCVGFIVALCIVVSGVWSNGLDSTALTISAFDTVFGVYGGWIVSFLSISFGFGVLVSYAYVARVVWLFLTNNRFEYLFTAIYSFCTFAAAITAVSVIWDLCSLAIATTLFINLYGLLMLLPKIKTELLAKLDAYKA
jgi:alanine or glycine:cation symporter, AGCS family